MALNEVLDEIRGNRGSVAPDTGTDSSQSDRKRMRRKPQSRDEIEAYRLRKIREEEARYLRAQKKSEKSSDSEPVVCRKRKPRTKPETSVCTTETSVESKTHTASHPKMMEPLQPLYLLKIPGLPRGECLAICLAHTEA